MRAEHLLGVVRVCVIAFIASIPVLCVTAALGRHEFLGTGAMCLLENAT